MFVLVSSTASQQITPERKSSKLYVSYFTTSYSGHGQGRFGGDYWRVMGWRGDLQGCQRVFWSVVLTGIAQPAPLPRSFASICFASQPRVPPDYVWSLGLTIAFSLAWLILKMYSRAETRD